MENLSSKPLKELKRDIYANMYLSRRCSCSSCKKTQLSGLLGKCVTSPKMQDLLVLSDVAFIAGGREANQDILARLVKYNWVCS